MWIHFLSASESDCAVHEGFLCSEFSLCLKYSLLYVMHWFDVGVMKVVQAPECIQFPKLQYALNRCSHEKLS